MNGYDELRESIALTIFNGDFSLTSDQEGDAVLKAITAAGIPIEALANGEMVAVPIEPTDAMYDAGCAMHRRYSSEMPGYIYKAMLDAAPKETADG